ncbi:hypothetical protein B0H14DRAFT_3583607 [Mycena olivaceomarginata]|nr:hypothetical protein B0H14DRAFT_3583607 [Mycena olivaceomarginata]
MWCLVLTMASCYIQSEEKEKEKEKEVVEKTTDDGKRKRKRKAALNNDDEESEDSKSKKVKCTPFQHLTSSTPPPSPVEACLQECWAGQNHQQAVVSPTPENRTHAREERVRLGSVEYEARQARKAAKWMAAANTGTAGSSKPPKPSKTLTEVEDEDSDKFDGGSGLGLDSESE